MLSVIFIILGILATLGALGIFSIVVLGCIAWAMEPVNSGVLELFLGLIVGVLMGAWKMLIPLTIAVLAFWGASVV